MISINEFFPCPSRRIKTISTARSLIAATILSLVLALGHWAAIGKSPGQSGSGAEKPDARPARAPAARRKPVIRRETIVRVALATGRETAAAGSTGGMTAHLFLPGRQGSSNIEIPAGAWLTVSRGPGGLLVIKAPYNLTGRDKEEADGAFRRVAIIPGRNSSLRFKGRRYRGNLDFLPASRSGFDVVNVVGIEDYLAGVVTSEMPSKSPLEALKAQAVASRSYCMERILSRVSRAWHLTDGTLSQCYGGIGSETASGRAAVAATGGKVLLWSGRPAMAVFSASCGGMTDSAREVWGGSGHEFLRGMECKYCRAPLSARSGKSPVPASLDPGDKGWEWEFPVDLEDLSPLLGKKSGRSGFPAEVTRLDPMTYCASGRVRTLSLQYPGGFKEIRAEDVRRIIGPDRIKSTWFEIAGQKRKATSGSGEAIEKAATPNPVVSPQPVSSSATLSGQPSKAAKQAYVPSPEAKRRVDSKAVFSSSKKVIDRLDSIEKDLRNGLASSGSDSRTGKGGRSGLSAAGSRGSTRVLIRGRGHGHGVGMCQMGAIGLARDGLEFEEILRHYYHGVGIGSYR